MKGGDSVLNIDVYLTALDRYIKVTHHDSNKAIDTFDVIVFLQREIESLRVKNEELKTAIDRNESVTKSVQEMADRWTATSKRIEQLGRMIEDGVSVGQIEDGGKMTIKNAACYQDIVSVLLSNGYFVCYHFDDENNGDTITIEYWRA